MARTVRATIGVKTNPITTISVEFELPSADECEHRDHDQRQREDCIDQPADRVVGEPAAEPVISPMIVPRDDPEQRRQRRHAERVGAPARTREKTSRPSWSVPNQCAELGPWSTASLCSSGSSGVSAEPVIAQNDPEQDDKQPRTKVFERTS